MTAACEDRTTRAVSAFLLERAHLLLPLSSQLGPAQPDFESAIQGRSMAPAIPAGSRIRVRASARQSVQVGDVVFYLAGDVYTVHRVVHLARRTSGVDYLITEGDARFAPDAPLTHGQILGTVVAVQIDGQWQPIRARTAEALHRRVVRAVNLTAMVAALSFSATAATRLAAFLLSLESAIRIARRWVVRLLARTRFEADLVLGRVRDRLDRIHNPDVTYRQLDVARINALLPVTRRVAVADAIADSLAASDNRYYFQNTSSYNRCHRYLPRGLAARDDVYPPNLAVLDFLAERISERDREVLLDFPCGIGALLVYARDLGLTRTYGFDNWTYLARTTAERFLGRFGLDASLLVKRDDLLSLPVTILSCVGFPLPMLMETSSVWSNPSVRYVLADRMTRPISLPGFRRMIEYPGLLTVFERVP